MSKVGKEDRKKEESSILQNAISNLQSSPTKKLTHLKSHYLTPNKSKCKVNRASVDIMNKDMDRIRDKIRKKVMFFEEDLDKESIQKDSEVHLTAEDQPNSNCRN
jgi:hypothetical protein